MKVMHSFSSNYAAIKTFGRSSALEAEDITELGMC